MNTIAVLIVSDDLCFVGFMWAEQMGKVIRIGNVQRDGINFALYATQSMLKRFHQSEVSNSFLRRQFIEIKTA